MIGRDREAELIIGCPEDVSPLKKIAASRNTNTQTMTQYS